MLVFNAFVQLRAGTCIGEAASIRERRALAQTRESPSPIVSQHKNFAPVSRFESIMILEESNGEGK